MHDKPDLFDLYLLDCPLAIALGIIRDWDKLSTHERTVVRDAIARLGTRPDVPAGTQLH